MAVGYTRKDFEFLGLMNVSEETVSLLDLNLTEGVRFDFSLARLTQIEPGQSAFLVKNREAFEMRYGSAYAIIGEYDGSLNNDGERLLLQSGTSTVVDLVYNDTVDWPAGTDGEGAYLILTDPGTKPDSSKAGSWRASTAEDEPLTYADWSASAFAEGATLIGPNDDADSDNFVNYLEFLLGGDPSDPRSVPFINVVSQSEGLPVFEVSHRVGVADALTFETGRSLQAWTEVSQIAVEELDTRPGPEASTEIRRYRVLQLTKDLVWTERFVRIRANLPAD